MYKKSLPRLNLSSPRLKPNPFVLPPEASLFDYRENQIQLEKAIQQQQYKKSLVARTKEIRPRVPPIQTEATSARSARLMNSENYVPKPPQEPLTERSARNKKMVVPEIIQDKREIFRVQLVIDKKQKEINRLENEILTEEDNYSKAIDRISKTSSEYKKITNSLEQELSQARIKLEAATQLRVEQTKNFKMKAQCTGTLNSDILRNQELLESYQFYSQFLSTLTPPGQDTFEYFTDPSVLIQDLDYIESQNCFLMEEIEKLERKESEAKQSYQQQFSILDKELQAEKEKIPVVEEFPEYEVDSTEIDEQIRYLAAIINKVYNTCFHTRAILSPLGMLERIEVRFQDLFSKLSTLDPVYVQRKQAIKEVERREAERKRKAEEVEREQRIKMENAIARATKPVKKKMGRPLCKRSVPRKEAPRDDDKEMAIKAEQQRIEELLYGEMIK